MSEQHSPEPWEVNQYGHIESKKSTVCKFSQGYHRFDNCDANARRIVACVNACAGWTNAELEKYQNEGIRTYSFETVKSISIERDKLKSKLDKITEAAQSVVARLESPDWKEQVHTGELVRRLKEYIAENEEFENENTSQS